MHFFIDYLFKNNLIRFEDIASIKKIVSEQQDAFLTTILRLGLLSEQEASKQYSIFSNIIEIETEKIKKIKTKFECLSNNYLRENTLLPMRGDIGELIVVVGGSNDTEICNALSFWAEEKCSPMLGIPSEILMKVDELYFHDASELAGVAGSDATLEDGNEKIERLRDIASEAPVIRLVQKIITDAIDLKASDIHLEPIENGLCLRYRRDGFLEESGMFSESMRAPVVSRIKILANLDIAERRLPQDGRIQLTIHGKQTDFRVATSPTLHGESVVLRILDQGDVSLDFAALGFSQGDRRKIDTALSQPHGIVLVTGPTGSGKTTTLYAGLKQLNLPHRKILTAEDPIEYTLDRVNQTQVKPQIGHDFAAALRSFLRQDPDVIMVGEIRDRETASIAIQASLTGHLLLSTLHTNSAAGAVTRLLDMGVEDYLLASTLTLVIGQRLVRKLCPACRKPYAPSAVLMAQLDQVKHESVSPQLFHPGGCTACGHSGYAGRVAIAELLVVDEAIQQLILRRCTPGEIEAAARKNGFVTLREDGLRKALAGETTLEEVLRATQAT